MHTVPAPGWAEVVTDVQAAWADAFRHRDVPRLAPLYTVDALFHGSRGELYQGRAGVAEYCAVLPPRFKRARFDTPALVVLTPGALAASGPVTFETEVGETVEVLRYRMTHVYVERDGRHLIAAHHASPEP